MRIRLTLKARFILVAGGAVAAVALAITAVAFLAIRTDLQNQMRQEVAARADAVQHQAAQYHGHIPAGWVPPHSSGGFPNLTYSQVVTADGQVWAPPGDTELLAPSAQAVDVADGTSDAFFSFARINDFRAMVYTEQIGPGLAVQVAEAVTTTDQEVSSIGTMLALLSVVGVLSATLLGWAVARAGLAPVARLAGVAEEVTLTGDPGRRVEVRRGDELGRLAMSFNAMLGALQRSLDAQRRLVSDASHELRTPLASLRINADVLLDHPEMPVAERTEILARVSDQVQELSRMVASVTDLARGEPLQRERSQLRFDLVAREALDAARRDWPQVKFEDDLAECTVHASADRVRVAVRNLLDNAAKFGPPAGPIEVSLAGGVLTVRDHGPGIDPDDLPFIFDRFYRATSSRSAPGSGLGLAVVQEIALGHGGSVTADPAPGGGTIMRLVIPGRRLAEGEPAWGNAAAGPSDVMAATTARSD